MFSVDAYEMEKVWVSYTGFGTLYLRMYETKK